ncbi:SRPBCC domain-containing protein [Rhodocytophaga aerolata]|uniref:SRPBCC domain-containing protein n=1 Tax=Rhodocytophaga aerolata TaxID=455078 RepID=A0ABT8R705_9BACT|nr:SRPBCC domain-containing protein [Rhodocytophaga aerolata]MDO1447023.1 SRPBCC domain-containing protein [Rhodocytophaga aerolata]
MKDTNPITVQITINAALANVWSAWTTPQEVMHWNRPFSHWHCPVAEINLTEQGTFLLRMEAKDGSEGFDHAGQYDKILLHERIEYTTKEGRKSKILFTSDGNSTKVRETFEPDSSISFKEQRAFVDNILANFKKHVENR